MKTSGGMAKWKSAPEKLVRLFEEQLTSLPAAQTRKMFGYPAAFVNGNMFAGLFRDRMILRLSDAERVDLSRQAGARPFEPMPGRPMREYLVVPPHMLEAPKELEHWLAKAFVYASGLPPKVTRASEPSRTRLTGAPARGKASKTAPMPSRATRRAKASKIKPTAPGAVARGRGSRRAASRRGANRARSG